MGSMSISSCRCCMSVFCVHHVAVLNAAFRMTCSLLRLVEDARGILQSRSHDCLIGCHECFLMFTPFCCCECFLSFVVACVLVLRCCECVCCMRVLGL